jgi:hypothetical protein
MNKWILVFVCLFFILSKSNLIAQNNFKKGLDEYSKRDTKTYDINSFQGKDIKVHIMPDYEHDVLKISCLRDTISIFDYWGVPADVSILNKNFIMVKYAVRGGSDVGLGNIMILCVSGNKICEAMHALNYMTGAGGGTNEKYYIKIKLSGNNKSNYKLNVHIYEFSHSTSTLNSNYDYNNLSILSFDKTFNVFYSIKEDVYNTFTIYDPKNANDEKYVESKQKIGGNFPVILLGDDKYYFINGYWYGAGENNYLNKYSSHN